GELGELVFEELRCPEVGGRVGQELALPATELVVEDAGAAEPVQVGDRLAVVVRGAVAAVTDDDGHLRRARVELTHDAVPGLVAAPLHPSFVARQVSLRGSSRPRRRADGDGDQVCVAVVGEHMGAPAYSSNLKS